MPWYTTADARRDAEKQAAIKNLENSVRNNEGPTMNDMEREYRQLCRIDENHGVQGLAQLGRNAIERVAQLEKELAAAVAERSEYWGALHSTKDELFECRANQRTLESDLRITRDQRDTYRARLAAIESAPTVAVVSECAAGLYVHQKLFGAQLAEPGAELIYRPAKDQT